MTRRFLDIALGSLAELETQITLARDIGYISAKRHDALLESTVLLGKKISALSKSMRR